MKVTDELRLESISKFLFIESEKHKLQVNEIAITLDWCHEDDNYVDIVVSDLFWNELSRYKFLIGSVVKSIDVEDLINKGYEETYYEWFECPKCSKNGLSKYDNFCSGCGVKIIK